MRNILNPKWLFIINTLPIAVLFILFYGQFNIIKTLLDENSIQLWKIFGLALGTLGLLNFGYAVYLTVRKQTVSAIYGIVALLSHIAFIYLYIYHLETIILNVPQWMFSLNKILYVCTFLMPTLLYSLFILVVRFTSEMKEHKAWVNFVIAIAIPVVGYLLTFLEGYVWRFFDHFDYAFYSLFIHFLVVIILIATVVFLFFLVRGIFIVAYRKAVVWKKYQWAWKIPIAIVLPLMGLLVNNGLLFNKYIDSELNIFGDFTNSWFYILAVANGILICLPNLENKLYRLFLFIGRSVTFAYTLYFFLVFLPFLPLSIVAIIAFGIGFLMLTPLLLFVIHVNELSKDFNYLKTLFSKKWFIGIAGLGFLAIPACITVHYLKDKIILHETLDYLYTPDYSKEYKIDKNSLQKTIQVIKNHKNRNDFFSNNQIPYLSSYFNWLVLDNLMLSDAKISHIEKVFFGETSLETWTENIQNEDVKITNISTNSTYDKSQNAWKSWVDLEITNKNENETWFNEYATTIDLPEGCWISDYYLYVDSIKEYGILAEKKSAMWVFSQIRTENRDPGILYYLTGNKVAFRVYPFAKNEVRKTGIEFLHKEPIKLNIDNHIVELGNVEETVYENVETENFIYVSSQQKQTLKVVKRQPYFHFIVDASEGKNKLADDFIRRMESSLIYYSSSFLGNEQLSFVNSYVKTYPLENNLMRYYDIYSCPLESCSCFQPFKGGFFLEKAIKTVLYNAYKDKSYPVIVVVTDSIQNAILDKDFSDFKFAFPENDLFFVLDHNGILQEHSLIDNPKKQLPDTLRECRFCETVLEYQLSDRTIAYLPNNNEPSIILKKDIFEITPQDIKEKNWQSALTMQAKWMSQTLHPETSDKEWLNLVKYSFVSKIMTHVTSYIVVENEAQKAMLKKKQEQSLSANPSLDLSEDTQAMSEPKWWISAILLGLLLYYKQIRKQRVYNKIPF